MDIFKFIKKYLLEKYTSNNAIEVVDNCDVLVKAVNKVEEEVGVDRLLSKIDEYNIIMQSNFNVRFEQYKNDTVENQFLLLQIFTMF